MVRWYDPPMPFTAGRALVAGGTAWIVATVQYAIVSVVAAAAWPFPYSLRDNYISDLGNTACSPVTGAPPEVCSPDHALANASFVVAGVLTFAGALLLRRFWPAGTLATAGTALWAGAGLGKIVVGLVPENTDADLHRLGALCIPLSSAGILLLALAVRYVARPLAVAGVVTAVTGLAGTVLWAAGQLSPVLHLGLGAGGAERLAAHPGDVWMVVVGVLALGTTVPITRSEAGS